jgi:[acyl-carrier-protein] S-malonyltransferase
MIAVLGLDRAELAALCAVAEAHGAVGIACHNAPGQTVVSGAAKAVAAVAAACERVGAGVVDLPVSAPFHSALLAPMVPAFAQRVAALNVSAPAVPVWDNVTAGLVASAAAVRASLVAQVCAPVLFEESLRAITQAGANHFVQCGPGDSLLRMARRVAPGARFETFHAAGARLSTAHAADIPVVGVAA